MELLSLFESVHTLFGCCIHLHTWYIILFSARFIKSWSDIQENVFKYNQKQKSSHFLRKNDAHTNKLYISYLSHYLLK